MNTGNVIAALASFWLPGLGQLIQGRPFRGACMFLLSCMLWWVWLGWIISLWATYDAAVYKECKCK